MLYFMLDSESLFSIYLLNTVDDFIALCQIPPPSLKFDAGESRYV